MATPLLDALTARSGKDLFRGHMPGHKGKRLPLLPQNISGIDFTELSDTGNLYTGEGPVAEAEALAAGSFGAEKCAFLTGGSTLGVLAGLSVIAPRGSKILVDRGCHKSVYNAMALCDLRPVYLYPELDPLFGVPRAVSPEALRDGLARDKEIRAVVITSPTYYGVISDISAISEVCSEMGVKLFVDEAHGAHLPFLEGFGPSAVGLGADISVASAHKTLPAPGQAAFLFWRGFDEQPRRAMEIFGTSSPSYFLMAALDAAREYMQTRGKDEYRRAAKAAEMIRKAVNQGIFLAMTEENSAQRLDPLRLVVRTHSGYVDADRLENVFGVVPEMADSLNLVFILTGMDSDMELERLSGSLTALQRLGGRGRAYPLPDVGVPRAELVLQPAEVLFRPTETMPLALAEGRVSARHIALFPPGIPLIAAGERIDEKHLANLRKRGYNINSNIEVV